MRCLTWQTNSRNPDCSATQLLHISISWANTFNLEGHKNTTQVDRQQLVGTVGLHLGKEVLKAWLPSFCSQQWEIHAVGIWMLISGTHLSLPCQSWNTLWWQSLASFCSVTSKMSQLPSWLPLTRPCLCTLGGGNAYCWRCNTGRHKLLLKLTVKQIDLKALNWMPPIGSNHTIFLSLQVKMKIDLCSLICVMCS